MNWFIEYIRNIVVFMLIRTIVLNIYPKSEFEKYIKLLAGFLLVILIMQPLLQMGGYQFNVEDYLGDFHIDTVPDYENKAEEFESKIISRWEEENEDI